MQKVLSLSIMLLFGLIISQAYPFYVAPFSESTNHLKTFLTMFFLSYIMIDVGREFEIDLKNKGKYLVDYLVACTAAGLPWIFCSAYFFFVLVPPEAETQHVLAQALLVGRFSAPTSAGVLFTMLGAMGLSHTWSFQKTRILAIFDDLDTVLFMIPLKIFLVGFVWQLGVELIILTLIISFGVLNYKKLNLPSSQGFLLLYAFLITILCEVIAYVSKNPSTQSNIHIEVLLPAFMLGLAMKPHHNNNPSKMDKFLPSFVSMVFLFCVGLSLPGIVGENAVIKIDMKASEILFHVVMITILSNLGKMFAFFCYKKEATWKQRLAVSISMFPRGEVGAGILAVSVGYGIGGPMVVVGFLSLALNLLLTGFFIMLVGWILKDELQDEFQDELIET